MDSDFADFGSEEAARLPSAREEDKGTGREEFTKPDKIVKRHHVHSHVKKTENEVFNPSKYYYANKDINQDDNNILEPVLKKIYEDRKEDISIPVYHEHSSKYY